MNTVVERFYKEKCIHELLKRAKCCHVRLPVIFFVLMWLIFSIGLIKLTANMSTQASQGGPYIFERFHPMPFKVL